METTFKRAKASNINNILAIARRTVDQSYRYFLGNETVDRYLSNDSLDNYLKNNIEHTWTLSLDNAIVGFTICVENIIDYMIIDVDFHRQGLGTLLLQHCESMLFENHDVIALESYEKNTKASDFYIANNWIATSKYKDQKSNATKIIFRKRLAIHTE